MARSFLQDSIVESTITEELNRVQDPSVTEGDLLRQERLTADASNQQEKFEGVLPLVDGRFENEVDLLWTRAEDLDSVSFDDVEELLGEDTVELPSGVRLGRNGDNLILVKSDENGSLLVAEIDGKGDAHGNLGEVGSQIADELPGFLGLVANLVKGDTEPMGTVERASVFYRRGEGKDDYLEQPLELDTIETAAAVQVLVDEAVQSIDKVEGEPESTEEQMTQPDQDELEGANEQVVQPTEEELGTAIEQVVQPNQEDLEAAKEQVVQPTEEELDTAIEQVVQPSQEGTEVVEEQVVQPSQEETEVVEEQVVQPSQEETEVVEEQVVKPSQEETEVVEEQLVQSSQEEVEAVEEQESQSSGEGLDLEAQSNVEEQELVDGVFKGEYDALVEVASELEEIDLDDAAEALAKGELYEIKTPEGQPNVYLGRSGDGIVLASQNEAGDVLAFEIDAEDRNGVLSFFDTISFGLTKGIGDNEPAGTVEGARYFAAGQTEGRDIPLENNEALEDTVFRVFERAKNGLEVIQEQEPDKSSSIDYDTF